MKQKDGEDKADLAWWATAELEDIPVDAVPVVMGIIAEGGLHRPNRDMLSGEELARAWVNMRRHAARTKRANTEAEARRWFGIAAALIPLAGIASPALWLAVRSWT